jgi:type IV pilus assembly protein PilW
LRSQQGVSLVELMVSLALGLVLIGGVLSLYLESQQVFRAHESLARLQEGGRYALDLMAREIRTAGISPCTSPLTANALVANPTPWWANTASGFLRGGESGAQGLATTGTAAGNHAQGTDSVLVLRASDDEGLYARILQHDAALGRLRVANSLATGAATTSTTSSPTPAGTTARIGPRDIALVCDDASAALFQVDTVQASTGVIDYLGSPLNCTTSLGSVDATCASAASKSFAVGALLVPWEPVLWYVGVNGSGQRSLYRVALNPTGSLQPVERVPGVQDLQIQYLTRNRNNAGALASTWVNASVLAGQWANPALEVAAVRLTLTLQDNPTTTTASAPLQRTFTAVVALRGRQP